MSQIDKLPSAESVDKLVIFGAGGTMGSTWALNCILKGFQVIAVEPDISRMDKKRAWMETTLGKMKDKGKLKEEPAAVMARLEVVADQAAAIESGAMIYLEVIPENLKDKLEFFAALGPKLPEGAVIWSNTSCLDVQKMAEASGRPEFFVGTHGMNPVHLTKGVEVVRTDVVDPAVFDFTMEIIKRMGKVPFPAINVPGFIVNRGFVAMGLHYVTMLLRGEFDVATGDAALNLSLGHPQGIFKLLDFIGHDTMVFVAQELEAATGDVRYQVPPMYLMMVEAGNLGFKSGRGFYDWSDKANPMPIAVDDLLL